MTHEPLEIRHLRYFLAVAEAGSFSRAADRLGISQPSVSQQMRELEAGLRVTLFQRRGKRILLTTAGLVFEEHARTILRQLENLFEELSGEPGRLRGTLRLGVVPFLDVALMPHLLGQFASTYPDTSLTVDEISSHDIETALEEGRVDVGMGFLTHHSPNLRYEHLCRDEFVLIVSETHPWRKRRIIQFSELHQQRLIKLSDRFVVRRMADALCRNHQVRPRTIVEISAIETLLRSLKPLNAAALLPSLALRGTTGLRAIRLQAKDVSIEIGLLRLKDSATNSTVGAFTKLAKTAVPKILGRSS